MAGVMTPEPFHIAALRQAEIMGKEEALPSLSLDHSLVLSAWEQMGGKVEFDPNGSLWDNSAVSLDLSKFCRPEQDNSTVCSQHIDRGTQPGMWMGQAAPGALDLQPLPTTQVIEASNASVANDALGLHDLAGKWRPSDSRCLGIDFGWGSPDDGAVTVLGDVGDTWLGDALVEVAVGTRNQLEGIKMESRMENTVMHHACAVDALAQPTKTSTAAMSHAVTSTLPVASITQQVPDGNGDSHTFIETSKVPGPYRSQAEVRFPTTLGTGGPFIMPFPSAINGLNAGTEGRTRLQCLQRYREKKARRLYTKKIRYELRKINADRRPRIKGRFVKKKELEEYLRQQALCKEKVDDPEAADSNNDYEDSDSG